MYKKSVPDIRKLLCEIEDWTAENSGGKERIKHMKKRIESSGGRIKKYFIPLKHRFLLKKHKKKKEENARKEHLGKTSRKKRR